MDTNNCRLAAAVSGDLELVRHLPMDSRALQLAIERRDCRMVEALLFAGVDPNDIEESDDP